MDDDTPLVDNAPQKSGSERSIWKRDPCACCERMSDMLRVNSNNRICDVCNKGPICYTCYCTRGEWLDVCVCESCKDVPLAPELAKLKVSGTYEPRFYKPNIQPICSFCQKKHAKVCCRDCGELYCDHCIDFCDACQQHFCPSCDNWDDGACSRCGDPNFEDSGEIDEGKDLISWQHVKRPRDFTGGWLRDSLRLSNSELTQS